MPGTPSEQVLSRPPMLAESADTSALASTRLRYLGQLEASRERPLPDVPKGKQREELLLQQMEQRSDDTDRTLEYFTNMDSALQGKLDNLDTMIKRCDELKKALQEHTRQQAQSEHMEGANINKRMQECGQLFAGFRIVFRKLLDDVDEKISQLNVSNVLQAMCSRMLDEPNDPYVEMDDLNCDSETLNFLLCHNLVQRHSHYCTKIKLIDPRS